MSTFSKCLVEFFAGNKTKSVDSFLENILTLSPGGRNSIEPLF